MRQGEAPLGPRRGILTLKSLSLRCVGGLLLAFAQTALPANWYVRPSPAGSNSGADWNNAWNMASLNSHWSSISSGDTVWLAGGTYTTGLSPSQSGTSGNRIYVERVRSTDSVPATAAGWSGSFDSQVVFNVGSGNTIEIGANYVTVDGRISSGILCIVPNVTGSPVGLVFNGTGGIMANAELSGPGKGATFVGYVEGLASRNGTGNMATNVYIHGFNQNCSIYNDTGFVFDHCIISDNGAANPSDFHPNLIEYDGSQNMVLRYCVVSNWDVVGIMMWKGSELSRVCGAVYLYGDIFKDAAQDLIWASLTGGANKGPVYFYNNTLINCVVSMGRGDSSSTAVLDTASQARNNIYWGSSFWAGPWHGIDSIADRDYEFAATALQAGNPPGTHCIVNGANPFVNYSGGNFQIISNISSTYPRNKGVSVANANGQIYNLDSSGTVRGADGAWDIGAYEYVSVGGNPQMFVSLSSAYLVLPNSYSFGSSPTNVTITNSLFTVQNVGTGTLTGTSSVAAPFSIIAGNPYSLGQNQSQAITVCFKPTAVSNYSRTMTFSAAGGVGTNLTLSGAGTGPTIPASPQTLMLTPGP